MTTEIVYRERRGARRYHWPEVQLNVWIIVVLAGAATCLGVFAWFMTVQTQMRLGTPWYVSHHHPSAVLKQAIETRLTQGD